MQIIYNFSPNNFRNNPPKTIKLKKYPTGAIHTQINQTYNIGIDTFYDIKQSNE